MEKSKMKQKEQQTEINEKNTNTTNNDIDSTSTVKDNEKVQENVNNKTKKSSIFSKITTALAIIIILFSIIISVRAIVFKKYDVFGYTFRVVLSGSMEPTINPLDVVVIKGNNNEYNVNDIIAFGSDDFVSVHRIIDITEIDGKKLIKTKGDNNNTPDISLVKMEDIKGKMVLTIPKIGNAAIFVQNNLPIVLILIIGFFIIIYVVKNLLNSKKNTES